jgi:hypothetical protein
MVPVGSFYIGGAKQKTHRSDLWVFCSCVYFEIKKHPKVFFCFAVTTYAVTTSTAFLTFVWPLKPVFRIDRNATFPGHAA